MEEAHGFQKNGENDSTSRAMRVLQKEYVLIGKTRVKSWKAWLIIGIVTGVVGAVIFVASRS